MKVIYVIATGEVVGSGSDGISTEPPHAVADAPAEWSNPLYAPYFFKWNGVDAIELKTGQELADAQAQKDAQDAKPAQKAKWRARAKTLIAKIKDGSATANERRRFLKLAAFAVFELYDEDDEA